MMVSRFFSPTPLAGRGAGDRVALPEALAHHALRVLRLRDGAPVVLFDGSGCEWPGALEVTGARKGAVLLGAPLERNRESPLDLVLVQSLASGEKMDWVVQKAVELGVQRIIPLRAERSVVRLDEARAAKRVAHWQQVAVAACEQCGRNRVPEVLPVASLDAAVADDAPGGGVAEQRFFLAPEEGTRLTQRERPRGRIALFIGPEGGWSDGEQAAFKRAGVAPVQLGPRVLRTETAGLAALAVMQALWGDV